MTHRFTVSSFFCGIGGLDLGFEWAGFDVVWASDLNDAAVASYAKNFGRTAIRADLNSLQVSEIPEADVIIGGPPCQSFSLVGQRRPDDPRGQLVFRYLEVIKSKRPKAFVMENVPGIEASKINGVKLTDLLIQQFSEMGYFVTKMKLDASEYLVPQKRKRIFLVGCLGARVAVPDPLRFAKECYGIDKENFETSAQAAIGDLGEAVGKGGLAEYRGEAHSEFSRLMRAHGGGTVCLHDSPRMSETDLRLVSHIPPGGNYQDVPDEHATPRIMKFKASGGRTTTYGRLHPERPSYTINTYFRRPNVGANFHYEHPRLITPREAMRFQSIPDHFTTVHSSQDSRNALIGNAVPPLLGQAVAWALREAMLNQSEDSVQKNLF
jgi:DNA (cytosine-5)-methyltransferase 1